MNIKYITFDSTGNPTGVGSTIDGTLIPNAIACTDAQATNWQGYININGVLAENTSAMLDNARQTQLAVIGSAYDTAIQQPVAYMNTTFQADSSSQDVLTKCLVAGSVPAGFYWLDANNAQVIMTFAQLQGLAGAILVQGQTAFAHLQAKKSAIKAVTTTVADVQAIVW
jgi:hypothetical protein